MNSGAVQLAPMLDRLASVTFLWLPLLRCSRLCLPSFCDFTIYNAWACAFWPMVVCLTIQAVVHAAVEMLQSELYADKLFCLSCSKESF